MSSLTVVFNGQPVVEYDRNKRLPGQQRDYLDRMDADMAAGIVINGEKIANPDIRQCAKFVAMQLIHAIIKDNESMIAAMCAWLATRLPELKQVRADEYGENIAMDLVFTENTISQVPVTFTPNLTKPKKH